MGDVSDNQPSLLARLRARVEGDEQAEAPPPEAPEWDPSLIPDIEAPKRSPEHDEIDALLESIGIIEAYDRWAGKGPVHNPGNRTESVMIRCPNPAHPDRNPSAWLNTDKGVWACGACGFTGGDKYDIAAWHFGYDVPGYKTKFPELKERMAVDLGYQVKRTATGQKFITKLEGLRTEPKKEEKPNPQPREEGSSPSNVIHLTPRPSDPDADPILPTIDWRSMTDSSTFLGRWMRAAEKDDLPEEYYFWHGLTAIGLANNNLATLQDNPVVKANFFICLYGSTGIGKSRSTNNLIRLLREAFPYDHSSPDPNNVYLIPSPGSSEALIDSFVAKADKDDDKTIPVTGFVKFDELSTLIGRAERSGNPMKPTLMEFYDSYNPVEHRTRGHGIIIAEDHFASCATTTQPRAIRDLLTQTDADAGFINRWIFPSGPGKTPIPYGREDIDISGCVDPLKNIQEERDLMTLPREVGLTATAMKVWSEFFFDVVVPDKKSDNNLISRMDLSTKKVMLALALDRSHPHVTERDVQDAIILYNYMKRCYGMLATEIGVGVFEDCRHAVQAIVNGHWGRHNKYPTALDVLRGINSRFSSALVHKVLETMVALGELNEFISEDPSGKKVPRYAMAN